MDCIAAGHGEEGIAEVASALLRWLGDRRTVVLEGPMGAGKTTLVRAICSQLGVGDEVSSPTFSIVNEYRDSGNSPVYHFDFYRISSESEAERLALDDYFASGHLCLMEWAGNIGGLLPEDAVTVRIEELADGRRRLTAE